jgi:hypothetical protein
MLFLSNTFNDNIKRDAVVIQISENILIKSLTKEKTQIVFD